MKTIRIQWKFYVKLSWCTSRKRKERIILINCMEGTWRWYLTLGNTTWKREINATLLLCYMFKNEGLVNLWVCVCRSISTCVWECMHLCTCTEGRRGARCPSLSLFLPFPLRHSLPESGARLFSARLKAKNPQASCLFLHWSWSDRHARDAQLVTRVHAANMLTCWISSPNTGVKF